MNITDYIKDMTIIAEKSGITSPVELNEVVTLALFKLLKSTATVDDFKKYKLEHYNENDKTLGIMEKDLFESHFIINKNAIVKENESTIMGDKNVQEVKKDNVKEMELTFLNVIKSSKSFNEFCENYSKILNDVDNANIKKFSYNSKVEKTLIEAYNLLENIKQNKTNRTHLIIEPFGEIQMNHVTPDFMQFVNKNINDKLEYLKEKDMLFRTLSSIDGINYTNVKKFTESYLKNELEEDSFLSKLLISDDPVACIEAVFEGEWFETYKETSLRSLKKSLLSPSVSDMYERHPIVNVIVDAMYDKYPYFNVNQNDMIQIKTILESNETTPEEMKQNKDIFTNELNSFSLEVKKYDEPYNKESKYTRVYATSPFGVLMEVGGRHAFSMSQNLSVLYLDEIKMNPIINDENEMICLNRFLKLCEDNKIICAYDGEKLSERAKNTITAHSGVASFDKSHDPDNLDYLLPYKIIIKDMQATYADFLTLKPVIATLPEGISNDEMLKTFQSKLKQQNKLTL
jgi:hypothetical protein